MSDKNIYPKIQPSAPPQQNYSGLIQSIHTQTISEPLYPEYTNHENNIPTNVKSEENSCAICIDSHEAKNEISGGIVTLTNCGHEFHFECVKKHIELSKNKDCPLCRGSISINPRLANKSSGLTYKQNEEEGDLISEQITKRELIANEWYSEESDSESEEEINEQEEESETDSEQEYLLDNYEEAETAGKKVKYFGKLLVHGIKKIGLKLAKKATCGSEESKNKVSKAIEDHNMRKVKKYSVTDMKDNGITIEHFTNKKRPYTYNELNQTQLSWNDLKTLGMKPRHLTTYGFFNPKKFAEEFNISYKDLHELGYSIERIIGAGMNTDELASLDFNMSNLIDIFKMEYRHMYSLPYKLGDFVQDLGLSKEHLIDNFKFNKPQLAILIQSHQWYKEDIPALLMLSKNDYGTFSLNKQGKFDINQWNKKKL